MSVSDTIFMLKYNFYEKDISQYSTVRIVTIINTACLIEDLKTKKRVWVMKYDIYPLNQTYYGDFWQKCSISEEIARKHGLL